MEKRKVNNMRPLHQFGGTLDASLHLKVSVKSQRDFYFCAIGFLVVLSFSQPLSFSSVLPKPLSETLTSARTAVSPTGQQL
jgi:hypothetical protein